METLIIPAIKIEPKVPTGTHKLILHNDDFNKLDWVIYCLIDICQHTLEQAEQCTMITHNNGKCVIKISDEETLLGMKAGLLTRQLNVTLEKIK